MTDITWTQTAVKLSQLQPWEGNPKTSTAKNAKQLKDSVEELGQFQDVAIGPFNGNGKAPVYDGHQRLSAWLHAYGMDYEVTAKQSSRPLTEQERRKVAIYSRQIGAWDWDVLSGWEPAELTAWGFDDDLLNDWRRDVAALGDFLESEEEPEQGDAEPQINRADELRELWGVESGQMWRLPSRVEGQEHRLICGDCTDEAVVRRVMGGEKAQYGMHDPPYGINVVAATDSGGGKPFSNGRIGFHGVVKTNVYAPVVGDDKPFDPTYLLTQSPCSLLWGANYYADKLEPQKGWIVWDKKGREEWRDNFSDCELAWTNLPIVTRIFRHTWMGMVQEGERETRYHPTQKPALLYQKIISECFKEPGIIIDFYAGSSPTIIAAENLSRQCRAVEISPAYVAVALQRYQDAFGITPELIKED